MTDQQTPPSNNTQNIAQAIQEVSDRAQLLVREEIELAKAEVSAKVSKLIKGAFVVAAVLFLLGALAGLIAARALKRGAPPTPEMAIDEAKRIRETVQSSHPEQTV